MGLDACYLPAISAISSSKIACQYLHEEKIRLAAKLAQRVERAFEEKGRVHFNVGGSSALEDSLKLVRNYSGRSEKRFQEIAGNAAEWIWEVDAMGLYTYSSSVVEDLLGYKPEEIVRQVASKGGSELG